MITSVDQLGTDYRRQLEEKRTELRNQFQQNFTAVFDSALGTFILVSEDKAITQTFYPANVGVIYYPPFIADQPDPKIPSTYGAEGYGVLRIEHIGLPAGYYPTTVIDGLIGTDALENFGFQNQTLLAQYPQNIRDDINNGFRHLPNNRTQGQGLPYLVYPNQRVIQVEVPMGGPLQFGYRITTQNPISTPFGDFGYGPLWEGTSGGGQAIVNPQPGLLHTVRIRWTKIVSEPVTVPQTTAPAPIPAPKPLQPTPTVPPRVQEEIRRVQILQADGLRPQFIPSTMPQPPVTGQLPNPFVRLVRAFQDPANTFRASSVAEMYSFSPSARSYEWIYEVGKPPTIAPVEYKFRNNTTNAVLRFQFDLPDWAETSTPRLIDMEPGTEMTAVLRFKESDAREKSTMNSRRFFEQLRWVVTPLDIRGPVYVLKGLSPLITRNVNPKQDPQLNSPQPPLVIQVGAQFERILEDNARVYAQLNPTRTSMVVGERVPVQFSLWIGPPDITPNSTNAKQLLFPANGVVWKSLNESVVAVDSPNASVNATLVGLNAGLAEINAEIVLPPSNVPLTVWQKAYANGIAGTNVVTRRTGANFQGILAAGTVQVATSRSQLR